MTAPSQVPVRFPSGMTTDFKWGPLANYGFRNPFFYHEYEDDFDYIDTQLYTSTTTGTSAALAQQAGDGGQVLFTTGTAAGNVTILQIKTGGFTVSTTGKKLFFLTRFQISDITNLGFWAGLTNVTTTVAGITDGIYITKADNSATAVNLVIVSGSTTQATVAIPTSAITSYLLVNTWIDMGFYVTRQGEVEVFFGYPQVGFIPQQQTPPYGAVAAYRITAATPALTFTTANLAPIIIAQTGNTSQPTLTADFMMAAKER